MNTAEMHIIDSHMKNLNTKWDEFSKKIIDAQKANTFSILYATDIHYIRKYAFYIPAYYKLKEMVEFSRYVGFDLLALTGDIVDGNSPKENQKQDICDVLNLVREAKTTSVLISKGNHDDCSWFAYKRELGAGAVISEEEWYSYAVNPIRVQYPIVLDEENKAGGYYYIDYPAHKIRVININTNDTPIITDDTGRLIKDYCGQWSMGISEKQLKWLVKALTFEEEGWSVIFMSHISPLYDGTDGILRNGQMVWDIIKAYKNGENGSVKSNEKYFEAEVDYDFTDNKSKDVLVYMCGHTHRDSCDVYDGITVIGTKNILGPLCNADKNWGDPNFPIDGSWDCVIIDKKERILRTERYGISSAGRQIKL